MKTNVIVKEELGVKHVYLRDVNKDTFPWTFTDIKMAVAEKHQSVHERNCDFEHEAEHYFNLLRHHNYLVVNLIVPNVRKKLQVVRELPALFYLATDVEEARRQGTLLEDLETATPVRYCPRVPSKKVGRYGTRKIWKRNNPPLVIYAHPCVKVTNIVWETDGEKTDLPTSVTLYVPVKKEDVADFLSSKLGWLVKSFTLE